MPHCPTVTRNGGWVAYVRRVVSVTHPPPVASIHTGTVLRPTEVGHNRPIPAGHQQSRTCLIGLKSGRSGRFRPIRRSGRWTEFSRFLPEFSPTLLGPALSNVEISDQTDHLQYFLQTQHRPYAGYMQTISSLTKYTFHGLCHSDGRWVELRMYCS